MCSCCCPPAINALFCLWIRSGCSKASVAGALTFFPPDPPLYKFERYNANGELMMDSHAADDGDDVEANLNSRKAKENNNEIPLENNESNDDSNYMDDEGMKSNKHTTGRRPDEMSMKSPSAHTMSRDDDNDYHRQHHENEIKRKKQHPAQALTDRALALRKKAKFVNERDALDATMGVTYKFIPDPRLTRPPSYSGKIEAVKIGPHRKTGNYVAALIYRVRPDRVTEQTKTIIYSHGNATDIGAMYFMQVILAKGLQCHVVMYDYSGYGESGGVPLENNTYNDIEMVYDYTLSRVVANREERNIVIYGQSVGSGPSCYIATTRPSVGGLILHSPFMSGMRVITPSRLLACLDIFPNINRIRKIQCPVMIIHGVLDEEVHISHGKALHDAVPERYQRNPWWVRDRGHNDITEGRTKLIEYVQRLKSFFESLERS